MLRIRIITIFTIFVVVLTIPLFLGCTRRSTTTSTTTTSTTTTSTTTSSTTSQPSEIEATEFQGQTLTPISKQRNNALSGTQFIDRETYILTVDGLVGNPLALTYNDLLNYPQEDRLMDMNCVEGWGFIAKWTGPTLNSIFNNMAVNPEALIVIFHTTDVPGGYTSLPLSYIRDNDIIIGLKDNDITLTPDRGFPFQIVAMSKYGYKWAKWVDRIELSSDTTFRGYWENAGYSNDAEVGGPSFD